MHPEAGGPDSGYRGRAQGPLGDGRTRQADGGSRRTNYYRTAKEKHVYLLTVYAKGAKDDLTAAERDARCKAVEAIDND